MAGINKQLKKLLQISLVITSLLLMSCSNSSDDTESFGISGEVSGLVGSINLLNNGTDALTVSNSGSFSFAGQLDEGDSYDVTVESEPDGQTCTVNNGSGVVGSSNITDIVINCVTSTFSVGGILGGLLGTIILQNNASDTLTLNSSGDFSFTNRQIEGSSYAVTVLTQPDGQSCSVNNASGTIAMSDITDISISCINNTYRLGGTLSGLLGSIVLQNNGNDTLSLSSSGDFSFSQLLNDATTYNVTVLTQPSGQSCTIINSEGTVNASDITDISISCITNTYTIGGELTGLQGSITLQNNSTDSLTLNSSGVFGFSNPLTEGDSYSVSVLTQPDGQSCSISNGSGTVSSSDINNIAVSCVTNTFTIGGDLTGLQGSIILQNNSSDDLILNASGSFVFSNPLIDGDSYHVTILTQPSGQSCSVSNGSGTVAISDINNITVSCADSTYSIGGTLSGLVGSVTLQNNGTNLLILNSSGDFSFNNRLDDGASYDVIVQTQPVGQTCSVSNGSGTVSGAIVNNISVNCVSDEFSVGGTVSGLSGTLSIQNNSGNILSISSNGVYVFVEKLTNSELYNVQITQNPVAQLCSIINGSGQINLSDITNIDITCSAETTTVSLSGSYQVAPLLQVDSDINDPGAVVNIDNGAFNSAQAIRNFSKVQGFATNSGTGRTTEGDRFASTADEFDIYRVTLQKNQALRMQVVDFAGADVFLGDLDLYLYDSAMNLVGSSLSVDEFESITVLADGEYFIAVQAFSGSSKYTLSLDGVSAFNISVYQSLDFKPGEAIIQFNKKTSTNSFSTSHQAMNLSHTDTSRSTRANFNVSESALLSSSTSKQQDFGQVLAQGNPESYRKFKTLQQIKLLNQRLDIKFAEPNYIYHPYLVPNDEFYNLQWHYPAINLPQAWDITTGSRSGSDVIVAVVDTGVFLAHPEFTGQLVSGYDFISDINMAADGDGIDANPDDPGDGTQVSSSSWHGTHVSGTVAALSNNSSSVAGVAWGAKIMPVRALGVGGGTGYDIIQSIRYAAGLSNDSGSFPAQKADIINLSLGGGGYSQSSQDAYNAVRAEGVIVVAAAGNENSSQLSYPASYDGVISVSATDFADVRAPYSNFGVRVDVAAPGGNVGADLNNDGYGDGVLSALVDDSTGTRTPALSFYQGTSMATPHVAGVLALMRAVYPALSPNEVDSLLSSVSMTTDIGVAGRDDLYGFGLIDALKAVQAAQTLENGGTPPAQPALIVATPNQLTMGLTSSATLILSNLGDLSTNVDSFSSDAAWLSVTASNIDINGLGEYQVLIDRTGLSGSSYVGSITFNLATGNTLIVPVSMQVGVQDTTGNVARIYMLLLDSNYTFVDQVAAVDQGNGVFDYSFDNVVAGSYFIIAGSDIDNDLIICQLAEACGGYPTADTLSTVEVINTDISGLDFVIDILANFGTSSLSFSAETNPAGFYRLPVKNKQLNLNLQ